MKRVMTFLSLMIFAVSFSVAQTTPTKVTTPASNAKMEFESKTVDYGTIERNSDPLRVFHFTNVGTDPLIIKHAKGSCGCTVPTWPKEPIAPGESGIIEVRYDTKRVGPFTKRITLTTNEEGGKQVLTIKGKVEQVKSADAIPKGTKNVMKSR